jgi:hypothetical protein
MPVSVSIPLIAAVGFVLGYWAARRESPARRTATGMIVGLVVALTPLVVNVAGR